MSEKKTVSILGCGWLGLPLAQTFLADGYEVRGSTTHPEKLEALATAGIMPYLIQFNPSLNNGYDPAFFHSDVLIINIPPGRRRKDADTFYPAQLQAILEQKPSLNILFVSSTSVYPDTNQEVTEQDSSLPEDAEESLRASGKALLLAEQLIQNYSPQATILRFCGLMGPDRHPGRFLAGKKLDTSGSAPVNYIHLDDCVEIIRQLIRQEVWGEVFNACADAHPSKEIFYARAAERLGVEPPHFNSAGIVSFKQVNSEKLKQKLAYQFIHPDPTDIL